MVKLQINMDEAFIYEDSFSIWESLTIKCWLVFTF